MEKNQSENIFSKQLSEIYVMRVSEIGLRHPCLRLPTVFRKICLMQKSFWITLEMGWGGGGHTLTLFCVHVCGRQRDEWSTRLTEELGAVCRCRRQGDYNQ